MPKFVGRTMMMSVIVQHVPETLQWRCEGYTVAIVVVSTVTIVSPRPLLPVQDSVWLESVTFAILFSCPIQRLTSVKRLQRRPRWPRPVVSIRSIRWGRGRRSSRRVFCLPWPHSDGRNASSFCCCFWWFQVNCSQLLSFDLERLELKVILFFFFGLYFLFSIGSIFIQCEYIYKKIYNFMFTVSLGGFDILFGILERIDFILFLLIAICFCLYIIFVMLFTWKKYSIEWNQLLAFKCQHYS